MLKLGCACVQNQRLVLSKDLIILSYVEGGDRLRSLKACVEMYTKQQKDFSCVCTHSCSLYINHKSSRTCKASWENLKVVKVIKNFDF